MEFKAGELAALTGGKLQGDADTIITGLHAFDMAGAGELTFAGGPKYLARLDRCRAACVFVPVGFDKPAPMTTIAVADPKIAFFSVLIKTHQPYKPEPGVHPSAVVAPTAQLGRDVHVGANAVIEDDAVIGDATQIGAGACVGRSTRIGARSVIHPNVTLYYDIQIGDDVIIHSGTVIGADGFGYVEHEGRQIKIPQTGTVVIHNGVEIGSNVSIDRATFGATVINEGAKIDNLCQVAHNVQVGKHAILAGQAGVAGSVQIGDYAVLAAQAGVRDNITIGERAIVGAKTGVSNHVRPGEMVFGIPAREIGEAKKQLAALSRLAAHVKPLLQLARKAKNEEAP